MNLLTLLHDTPITIFLTDTINVTMPITARLVSTVNSEVQVINRGDCALLVSRRLGSMVTAPVCCQRVSNILTCIFQSSLPQPDVGTPIIAERTSDLLVSESSARIGRRIGQSDNLLLSMPLP